LLTNGLPTAPSETLPYPHLPILACNMDLQWMAEAVLPRFGHGAFLLCLEDLYKKITGQELVYTALVGKPSEITYRHGEHILQHQAKVIYGDDLQSPLKNIYFVGDNVCTDILGANLYHKYLSTSIHKEQNCHKKLPICGTNISNIEHLFGLEPNVGAENCTSILVETGVYSGANDHNMTLNHSPRDFLPMIDESLQRPSMIMPHVLKAVEAILEKEEFS